MALELDTNLIMRKYAAIHALYHTYVRTLTKPHAHCKHDITKLNFLDNSGIILSLFGFIVEKKYGYHK